MPRLIPFRPAAACALALALLICGAAVASAKRSPAKGTAAKLRVLAGQKLLAERWLRTGTTAVPTSPRATCLGPDKGGSGRPVRVPGATALGLLAQAARHDRRLRPLWVTDAFSFGLAVCGIGGLEPPETGFWYLKVNHENPEVGGDAAKLGRGDEVLWFLSPSFEPPPELGLRAPRRVRLGRPFAARVIAYDDAGDRSPVAGAKVRGARLPTNRKGFTVVTLRRPGWLIARKGGTIPSNRVPVCIGQRCPGR